MASKNTLKTIGALALIEGTQAVIRKTNQSEVVLNLCQELLEACRKAHKLWPDMLLSEEADKITNHIQYVEKSTLMEQWASVSSYTSFSLGLIDEIYQHVTKKRKVAVIDQIHDATFKLHILYDIHLDKWDIYDQAGKACDLWNEITV